MKKKQENAVSIIELSDGQKRWILFKNIYAKQLEDKELLEKAHGSKSHPPKKSKAPKKKRS